MSVRIKHEWVIVPAERCDAFDAAVDELRQAQIRAQEVAFGDLPGFFRELPAWACLVHHHQVGARRSWSDDAAAANLGAALTAASDFDWTFLDGMAQLLNPEETVRGATALAEFVSHHDRPLDVVMRGLAAFRGHYHDLAKERAEAAAELAAPDGGPHGVVGDFVELLRNLCATFHDAARRRDGVLYLSCSAELTPSRP